MELDPRLKYLFDKGYTPETIKEKATQGVDPLNLYYFERGYSPKDVQIEQNKLNEGFGKKLLRGVLEPVATLVTRPFQVAKALTGAETPEEQGVSLPFLGRIEAPTTGQDIVKDVGRGLETVSLGIGGGGAKTAIQTGMKGLVKRGFVEGLGVGLKSGALMSFGQAIQEAENTPADIAYKTIFGTTVGGLTGGLFGSLIPIAGKAINKTTGIVKKFSNIESLNDELVNLNKTALRPTNSQLRKWGEKNVDPMKTYTEIFGARLPQVDKNNRFIQESLQDLIGEVDNVYRPSAEAFNTILRNSPEVNSIRRMGDRAIREVENSNLTADARTKAIEKINTELNALKAEAKQAGKLFGDDNVPVDLIDNWKDRYFTNTKYFGPEEAGITNTANRSLGFTFKEGIEEVIKDIGVKQYNKQLQQYIVLKDFLEELNGKLAGTGGRMTRLVSRGIGSVIGSNEGILGSTFGALTGDKLAQLWINPSLSPYRWLISMQLNKLPQSEKAVLVDEANAIIKQMFEKRMNTLNLPDPSFIPMGAATPPVSGTIKPQGPGGLFEYFENLKASQKAAGVYKIKEAPQSPKSQPAIMKPTIAVNKKPIDKTIPLEPKKSKTPVDKSLQGGYIQAGGSAKNDLNSSIQKAKASGQSFDEWVETQTDPLSEFKTGVGIKDPDIARGTVKEAINDIGGIKNVERGTVDINRVEKTESINTRSERYKEVERDVKAGTITPIIVDDYLQIMDGHHRLEVYKSMGMKEIPVVAPKGTDGVNVKSPAQLKAEWDKVIPNKEGGFVRIMGKEFREIPEPTKREIMDAIDYLKMGRNDSKMMDETVDILIEKYNINPNWTLKKIIDTFEKLINNTKTSQLNIRRVLENAGSIATSPLGIGAGATALGVGALKYAEKKSK
jgi:hypothetical protein